MHEPGRFGGLVIIIFRVPFQGYRGIAASNEQLQAAERMDEALIRRAQGGDATSFAELLDLHYDTIYRFAWKWCGHAANAEDIAQLACMKLATSLTQFRFQAAFTSWLYRLVISCAQDWQRVAAASRPRRAAG